MSRLLDTLRRLAEAEPTDLPVLSIYLDMRPQATGQSPGQRASMTVLRDRLDELDEQFGPRGADLDSFRADRARLEEYLEHGFDVSKAGLGVFACHGTDLWEVVEAGVPFDDEIRVGRVPDVYQLARLMDDQETAVVALVDTNSARLFLREAGWLREVGGPDDEPDLYGKREPGGWSQARYQRRVDERRSAFAREQSAPAIEDLVRSVDARRVVLAGDPVGVTPLLEELPDAVRGIVQEVVRLDQRATREDVVEAVTPVLERVEAADEADTADRLMGAVRADGMAVAGLDDTRDALRIGSVLTLAAVAPSSGGAGQSVGERNEAALDRSTLNELIRLAVRTDAQVEIVEGHEGLEGAGGVGALLRFKAAPGDDTFGRRR